MQDPRAKEFDRALRTLTPVFQRKLAAKDVRHDLYGKEQLTWNEYERIGERGGGEGRGGAGSGLFDNLFYVQVSKLYTCT